MKNFDLAVAANISSNSMDKILEKLVLFRGSNEFELLEEGKNTLEYQINYKDTIAGKVIITFKPYKKGSLEIGSIQILNKKGESLLLNEFTSAVRLLRADFYRYTYSSKQDLVMFKEINGWV